MIDLITNINNALNSFIWGVPAMTCIIGVGLYLAIRINQRVYGVVGIAMHGNQLDSFEHSVLLSMLGEGALALENEKNAREKEEAAILAKNEQLRANLLRAISHDLRTPLTLISGYSEVMRDIPGR